MRASLGLLYFVGFVKNYAVLHSMKLVAGSGIPFRGLPGHRPI